MRLVLGLIVTLFTAGGVFAQCSGADLRSSLSDAERQELDTRVAATPYATGNHWLATRGDMRIHLIGTVHLDDPRLDAPTERLRPLIEEAAALLLEMTPADEQALQQDLVSAPDKLLLTDTPLPEIMSEEAWAALSEAVTPYGIIGIKVWIFKGEIMEHDPSARDRKAQELQDGPAPRGAGGRR